jgi:hypothetical protein
MSQPANYHISCELDCTTAPLFGCSCCKFEVETKHETRYVLKDCTVSMYDVVTKRQPAKLVCANITRGNENIICCFCMAECDWRWHAMQCIDPHATEPYLFYTCGACSEFGLNEISNVHSSETPMLIRCADSCVLYKFDAMHRMDD